MVNLRYLKNSSCLRKKILSIEHILDMLVDNFAIYLPDFNFMYRFYHNNELE